MYLGPFFINLETAHPRLFPVYSSHEQDSLVKLLRLLARSWLGLSLFRKEGGAHMLAFLLMFLALSGSLSDPDELEKGVFLVMTALLASFCKF